MNGLKANSVYTVKGKYKVTDGELPTLRVGLIAFNSGATQGYTQSGEFLAVSAKTPVMSEAAEFSGFIHLVAKVNHSKNDDCAIFIFFANFSRNHIKGFILDDSCNFINAGIQILFLHVISPFPLFTFPNSYGKKIRCNFARINVKNLDCPCDFCLREVRMSIQLNGNRAVTNAKLRCKRLLCTKLLNDSAPKF